MPKTEFNCQSCTQKVIDTRKVVPNHLCSECESETALKTCITCGQTSFLDMTICAECDEAKRKKP